MAYRKIEDSKLTAIANAIRAKLGATNTMTPDKMPGMIESIGIGVVPDYWKSYLASKATEIDTALNNAGENKSAFLWYTDAHWTTNYGMSPMILKYLSKHTGMEKTFFGGDVANDTTGEIATITAWQELVKDIPNHHGVIGNHDNQVTDFATVPEKAEFFVQNNRTGDMSFGTDATNGKMYYYIDNHIENTRYICLSTGRMWVNGDEMMWCVDVLNSTPKNWHIVIISHLWVNYTTSNGVTQPVSVDYAQSYLDMFDAYNYRESGTTAVNSVAYNFTNAAAKIEFLIGGHLHRDYDFATARGIPVILTECDESQERDSVSVATKGTTTENCVYAIIADYSAKKVKVINVGRGKTRSVAIADVVTYTNWVKKAIDTDGSIYNGGKGYIENYRLEGGSTTVAYTGRDTTGFISAKKGDVLRFRNIEFKPGSHIYCARYTSAFAYHSQSGFGSTDSLSAWSPVFDDAGNIIQLTIASAISSSAVYFRFTVQDISENSIITVNEEID